MPLFRRANNSEIAPCILSQVRFALGLTNREPLNDKVCSTIYWNEVVEIVGLHYEVARNVIDAAKR